MVQLLLRNYQTLVEFDPAATKITDECTNKRELSDLNVCDQILITSNPKPDKHGTPPTLSGNFNNMNDKAIYSTVPLSIDGKGNGNRDSKC